MTDELTFRAEDELYGEIPVPNPTYQYLENQQQAQQENRGYLLDYAAIAELNQKVKDALELGWCVKCPASVSITTETADGTGEYEVDHDGGPHLDGFIERLDDPTEKLGDAYVRVDTGWEVTVPEGFDLLQIPIFAISNDKETVLPERLTAGDSDGDWSTKIQPVVRLNSRTVEIPRGYGLTALIPIPSSDFNIDTEVGVRGHEEDMAVIRDSKGNKIYNYYVEKTRGLHPRPSISSIAEPE